MISDRDRWRREVKIAEIELPLRGMLQDCSQSFACWHFPKMKDAEISPVPTFQISLSAPSNICHQAERRFEPSEFSIINDATENSRRFRTGLSEAREVLEQKEVSLSAPFFVEYVVM